ncbi:hypothetical protein [Sandaracinobacteroides saxicola]|uniref:Uncharacterized protein n=1 Tax=Sandaracinobacteroides saxicola TaxID=2759707 RepID=A0A7G5IJU7_9SPHN|nr:hypothetical protein [Sandaracinobacteroides saxicola]QMW23639.1 hypothetical protein H3309_03880 [Sandaracinobacteroides saxicola]
MEQADSSPKKPHRTWEKEEQWHWEQEEAARLAEEQRVAEEREAAIEQMVSWFFDNFEDPQNKMHYDSEDEVYYYPYGGPFDAADVLSSFVNDYPKREWIEAAVERIQHSGTYEWAPTSHGEYYEHPEHDVDEADLSVSAALDKADAIGILLAKVDRLERRLDEIAPTYGHNGAPDEVGVPPYDNEDHDRLKELVAVVRNELSNETPDSSILYAESEKAASIAAKVIAYASKIADTAVQESTKTVAKYGTLLGMAHFTGFDLAKFGVELANLSSDLIALVAKFFSP